MSHSELKTLCETLICAPVYVSTYDINMIPFQAALCVVKDVLILKNVVTTKNCEYRCYVKSVHVVVMTPYNFDSTNATSTTICEKGSSVAATLSMALVFVIYSFLIKNNSS